jgi:hypothetical protein
LIVLAFAAAASKGHCPQGGSRATLLPLSGEPQCDGTSLQQSAMPLGSSGVNTLKTQVNLQGSCGGSVYDPNAPAGALILEEAISHGLECNLGKLGADAASRLILTNSKTKGKST